MWRGYLLGAHPSLHVEYPLQLGASVVPVVCRQGICCLQFKSLVCFLCVGPSMAKVVWAAWVLLGHRAVTCSAHVVASMACRQTECPNNQQEIYKLPENVQEQVSLGRPHLWCVAGRGRNLPLRACGCYFTPAACCCTCLAAVQFKVYNYVS